MTSDLLEQSFEFLEKANANLEPERVTASDARKLMALYARLEKSAGFGVAILARKLDDATEVARATGTSTGKAKAVVATGKVLASSDVLGAAMQGGDLSLDQAAEIASAEESAPGSATELLQVAREAPLHVLRDKARALKLEAEQHRGLGERQRAARRARTYSDGLGMVNINLTLEPHVGAPIVTRAEAEAARVARKAKAATGDDEGRTANETGVEPFERYLADA